MKRARFSEEQIVGILKESEAGLATDELCRKYGICGQTFYRWAVKDCGKDAGCARLENAARFPLSPSSGDGCIKLSNDLHIQPKGFGGSSGSDLYRH